MVKGFLFSKVDNFVKEKIGILQEKIPLFLFFVFWQIFTSRK
jgi:hypothetical protein